MLLEQKLERELLIFGCRHHIYELVLRTVFEAIIQHVASSPDIPLFNKFRKNWKNIDPGNFELCTNSVTVHWTEYEVNTLLDYYRSEILKKDLRHDYRELVELSIIFLGGDKNKTLKIRPPGPMHQARWMSRALYSLKIALLSAQFSLPQKDKLALLDVCSFIVMCYVKSWLKCTSAMKAPQQDLDFLNTIKTYETVDEIISNAATKKFCQHLWYLTDETAALGLFDDSVDQATKARIVENFRREYPVTSGNRFIPSVQELTGPFYGKF